jgi:hypothetical protein
VGEREPAPRRYLWLQCACSSSRRIVSGVPLLIHDAADVDSSRHPDPLWLDAMGPLREMQAERLR